MKNLLRLIMFSQQLVLTLFALANCDLIVAPNMVDISGLDKAQVLLALYDGECNEWLTLDSSQESSLSYEEAVQPGDYGPALNACITG